MKSIQFLAIGCATAMGLWSCASSKEAQKPVVDPLAQMQAQANTPAELFALGVKQFEAGQLDAARETFTKALAKDPQMVNAQFNLGLIAEKKGELRKAEEAYLAALKLAPSHKPTLLNLGKIYRLQDKFQEAIALYEEALKEPGREYDVDLLNNLTVAYRLAKQFDKAEAAARKVLSRTKDDPDAYKNLALIYYDQGNYRLAEFISNNAKKLDEKDPGVYNNLGMIYLKMNERPAALAQFKKAVALDDKFAPGHVNIGAMALSYRDYETAVKAFSKAVALDPNSYETQLAYAFALDGLKGRDPKQGIAAGEQFEKVLTLKPEHPEAICGAGWAYGAERTGFDKAEEYLTKCKGLPSTSPEDQQLIDKKLKTIAAMRASGKAQQAAQVKEKPKASSGGAALLDKVSEEAAKQEEAATGGQEQPAAQPAETGDPGKK